jgi:hypothetical protein
MQLKKWILGLFAASAIAASFAALESTVLGSGAPAPDNGTVFVADVNNVIHQISNGQAVPVLTIGGTNFRDIIVTDDFNFIIANHTQSGTVLIASLDGASRVITSQIPSPEGLDMGPNGDVYVSSDGISKIYRLTRSYAGCPGAASPACDNGGYVLTGTPISVEYAGTPVQLVADVAVASSDNGGLNRGDVLVAVAKPAMILRYTAGGTLVGSLGVSFSGEQPSAMTFGPGGSILVTTEEGSLWQFPATGGAPIAKVSGKARGVVFGINGGTSRAFVTVDPGSVQRFDFANGALVSPPTPVATNLNNPRGVTFADAGGAALSTGADVTVETSAGETTFESVSSDGQTNAECYFFEDTVGLRRGDGTLHLQDVSSLPNFLQTQLDQNDVVIPANVQGFVPAGGSRPLFRLCITETTAGVDGIKQIHSNEGVWLNYDPPCPLDAWGGPSAHANSYYAPEIGKKEYPIIDWDLGSGNTQRVVQNVAVGCGSDQSWSKGRGSLVVLSAKELTTRDVLVSRNLMLLDKAIASGKSQAVGGLGDFITKKLKSSLRRTLRSASGAASRARYADVVTTMTGFLNDVDGAAAGDFTPTGQSITVKLDGQNVAVLTPDVKAELKVRANAVRFEACTQLAADQDPMPGDCSSLTLP